MIASLRGRAITGDARGLVLDVGGVGYLLQATPSALRKADGVSEVELDTHLHVREDALQLFGFANAGERELFEKLLAVSGVGPKVALAIVSGHSAAELRKAILREDAELFESIPGIGRKTAQRVVLELKEKITPVAPVGEEPVSGASDGHKMARDALVELGYTASEAEQCLADTDPDLPPEERVRQALKAA